MADDNLTVVFGANIAGLTAGINQVKGELEGLAAFTESLQGIFSGLAQTLAAAFAVDEIKNWINEIVEAGVDLQRMEVQLGATAQQVNVLKFAAEESDVNIAMLTRSITTFARNAEEAQGGTSRAARAFQELGINVKEYLSQGHSLEDLFETTTKKLAEYRDNLNKTGVESLIFGGRSSQIAQVIKELGLNYDEMDAIVKRSGVTFNGFEAQAVDTKHHLIELEEATQGLAERLFVALKPNIDGVIKSLTDMVEWFNKSPTAMANMENAIKRIDGVLFLMKETIDLVIHGYEQLDTVGTTAFGQLEATAAATLNVITSKTPADTQRAVRTLAAIPEAAADQWKQTGDEIKTRDQQMWSSLIANAAKYADEYGKTVSNVIYNEIAGPFRPGGQSGGNKNLGVIDTDKVQSDIQTWDAALNHMLLTKQVFGQQAQAFELQYWNRILTTLKQGTQDYEQVEKKIYQLEKQQYQQNYNDWKSFFASFNSGIEGMLRGTQSWAQAMESLVMNVFNKWLVKIEEIVAAQLAGDKTMGDSGRSFSLARIQADAAKAYSGVYGFLAPALGPFAAVPAAAAYASVIGMEALIPSFDVGSWNVPSDMMANIHKGEMIIPARQAESIRSGDFGGGGGVNIHFNGPVYGQRDFNSAVAKAVSMAHRNANPNLRVR